MQTSGRAAVDMVEAYRPRRRGHGRRRPVVSSCPQMSVVSYQVRRARGDDEMQEALALRHEVFCREQGVPEFEELDGRDPEGIHLVAVADGELVGTCRLLHVGHTVQFSRLAVRADARRQGIATKLLERADAESR